MSGLPAHVARRWYAAGTILSVVALVFALISQVLPRVGYPLAFTFTMSGILAVTRPGWEFPAKRSHVLAVNSGVFVIQICILYFGLRTASA